MSSTKALVDYSKAYTTLQLEKEARDAQLVEIERIREEKFLDAYQDKLDHAQKEKIAREKKIAEEKEARLKYLQEQAKKRADKKRADKEANAKRQIKIDSKNEKWRESATSHVLSIRAKYVQDERSKATRLSEAKSKHLEKLEEAKQLEKKRLEVQATLDRKRNEVHQASVERAQVNDKKYVSAMAEKRRAELDAIQQRKIQKQEYVKSFWAERGEMRRKLEKALQSEEKMTVERESRIEERRLKRVTDEHKRALELKEEFAALEKESKQRRAKELRERQESIRRDNEAKEKEKYERGMLDVERDRHHKARSEAQHDQDVAYANKQRRIIEEKQAKLDEEKRKLVALREQLQQDHLDDLVKKKEERETRAKELRERQESIRRDNEAKEKEKYERGMLDVERDRHHKARSEAQHDQDVAYANKQRRIIEEKQAKLDEEKRKLVALREQLQQDHLDDLVKKKEERETRERLELKRKKMIIEKEKERNAREALRAQQYRKEKEELDRKEKEEKSVRAKKRQEERERDAALAERHKEKIRELERKRLENLKNLAKK
ncbi:hypothetical protein ADUPG1_008832 [Aduncisulcus paluster]|uniref:Trichohyalin-plectin-homology domain-containing protein n=1 Tax=Aduncisulcus paluster TaxID=2918883 RepID=A0ABQ5KTE6_9EUKA|nr:hypothetical protein ADUPG1_008832 [Aduncisulcus paluster]